MDFTPTTYTLLLTELLKSGFKSTLRFSSDNQEMILRHDVDKKPIFSLRTAQIESNLGISAIYYFRNVSESWDSTIIRNIAQLGHEIGFHYESLTTCNGDIDAAYLDFLKGVQKLSDLIGKPIKTICMHGSPRSPYDSRDIWKQYDYHTIGIDYEPYMDTDWSKILYLTDTGRCWDGYKVSVRDKIPSYQDTWIQQGLSFHSTSNIIDALQNPQHPLSLSQKSLIITTHPQRWMPFGFNWLYEFATQNIKNRIKKNVIRKQLPH